MCLTCTAGAKCFSASEHRWGSEGRGTVSTLFNRQEQEHDHHSRQLLLLLAVPCSTRLVPFLPRLP